jgi:kynureninase
MKETDLGWDLGTDLGLIRSQFPVLDRCTYLISNSLGAVPKGAKDGLDRFYSLWAEQGVSAWRDEWWDLSHKVGGLVASLLGAEEGAVTMLANATTAHWVALSTLFKEKDPRRNTIVMTDLDFPSTIYAVSAIAGFMGWKIDRVKSQCGQPGIEWEQVAERIDERTLCVAVSHVFFKSACILDVRPLVQEARRRGALTLIDGYHAPGTIPVDVRNLEVDFYVGGCLKWLCGGPGNAFLYVRPEHAKQSPPSLTGWMGHRSPFRFETEMEHVDGAYRYMSGTPAVPCLYTAVPGLEIIQKIGIDAIRARSLKLTATVLHAAQARDYPVFTPTLEERRGGAVSMGLPHAFQVKQALEKRGIKVDYRRGEEGEDDVIRIGPHFYTQEEEIHHLFQVVDRILESGEHRKFPDSINHVT